MILLIADYLKVFLGIKIPAVFSYYSTRMMLAAITSLLISIFLGPSFIKKLYELKIGQSIRMEECPLLGQLHAKKKDTPTMGGVLILFSMLVSLVLWMDLTHIFTFILLITTLVLGLVGGRDDYLKLKYKNPKGLSAKKKLAAQLVLSGFLALYLLYPPLSQTLHSGKWFTPPIVKEQKIVRAFPEELIAQAETDNLPQRSLLHQPREEVLQIPLSVKEYASRLYIPFFKDPIFSFKGIFALLGGLFIMIVVTGSSNAVNLSDGLDGLAAGCLIMVASGLAFIAFVSNNIDIAGYLNILYIEGSGEIAIYLCAFVGACLGFLWYNAHPAQVFMGDIGSLTLGGVIGVSAVLLKREILLAVIGGIFVAEAMSVILQVASYKLRNKKRIFLIAPLHHHYEYKGWPETKVVVRFWIVALLLAIVGIASLKFQ